MPGRLFFYARILFIMSRNLLNFYCLSKILLGLLISPVYYQAKIVVYSFSNSGKEKSMIRAWLIRPLPLNGVNRVKEFKENGFVAIGWPQTGSLKGKTKEEIRALISQPPYSYAGVILGNYTATIDIFVNQMRVGDLLLMPNGEDIHLGQIVGDYDFDPRVADDATGYPACQSRRRL